MKNVIVAGVAAIALVGCGSSEEVVAPEAAPVVEEAPVEASAEVLEEAKEAAVANQDEKSVADGETKPE